MHALSRQWGIDQSRPYSAEGKLVLFNKLHKIVLYSLVFIYRNLAEISHINWDDSFASIIQFCYTHDELPLQLRSHCITALYVNASLVLDNLPVIIVWTRGREPAQLIFCNSRFVWYTVCDVLNETLFKSCQCFWLLWL